MGYELALDFADELHVQSGTLPLPDVILYPTGGGTGLIGMWKAFEEMERLGWIGSQRPRMVVVQAEHCAPIATAFHNGSEFATLFPNAATVASGLRVPAAVGDFLMLRVLRESQGTAITISDADLMAGVHELARLQGVYACPEGGAVWKAAQQLLRSGWLSLATSCSSRRACVRRVRPPMTSGALLPPSKRWPMERTCSLSGVRSPVLVM